MAPAGRVLLSGDYAQMELRLMGHYSGDPMLVAMLSAPDQDPFRHWAAQWLHVDPSQVSTSHSQSLACLCQQQHLAQPAPERTRESGCSYSSGMHFHGKV